MMRVLHHGPALLLCLISIIVSESAKHDRVGNVVHIVLEIPEDQLEKAVQDHSILMVMIQDGQQQQCRDVARHFFQVAETNRNAELEPRMLADQSMRGRVQCAQLNATACSAGFLKQHAVSDLPSFKLFRNGRSTPLTYSGAHTTEAMEGYLELHLSHPATPLQTLQDVAALVAAAPYALIAFLDPLRPTPAAQAYADVACCRLWAGIDCTLDSAPWALLAYHSTDGALQHAEVELYYHAGGTARRDTERRDTTARGDTARRGAASTWPSLEELAAFATAREEELSAPALRPLERRLRAAATKLRGLALFRSILVPPDTGSARGPGPRRALLDLFQLELEPASDSDHDPSSSSSSSGSASPACFVVLHASSNAFSQTIPLTSSDSKEEVLGALKEALRAYYSAFPPLAIHLAGVNPVVRNDVVPRTR